jgi:dihydroneopterin aldolase
MKKFLLISLILLDGCIYSFRSFATVEYKSITINSFTNNTLQYGLENIFYQNTVDEFIRDGRIKLMETGAETILSVVITDYKNEPFTFDEYENIKEYRIDVELKLSYQKGNGEGIWEKTLKEWVTYDSSLTEDDGIQSLAEKVASSIVRTVLE